MNEENAMIQYAKRELELAGISPTSDDEWCVWMYDHIMKMVEEFSKEGHSGASAKFAADALSNIFNYQPLTPLTGNDDEWVHVYNDGQNKVYQNNRCSHVFKDDTGAYDNVGIIYREPNGVCYTNFKSRVYITFPYKPKSTYVDVDFPTHEDF